MSELWGENPPNAAENALQAHISRLRRKFNGIEPNASTSRLTTVYPGYQLSIGEDELDAAMFTRAVRKVHSTSSIVDTETVQRLRQALSLWRGPALGGPVRGTLGQSLVARYEQARLSAFDLLFDSELRLGRSLEIVEELSELVELEPFNERFCEQLMIALYRSGRQADALNVYRKLRGRMVNELGVEPSPELRRCELAILEHDPMVGGDVDHVALRS